KSYNWGSASQDYAYYRDIYPENLFERLHVLDIGKSGQTIVDLGTGTGFLPRYLNKYGAFFIGVDISKEADSATQSDFGWEFRWDRFGDNEEITCSRVGYNRCFKKRITCYEHNLLSPSGGCQ
ncbi:MAG: hypothetical protein PVI26_06710, partial [Chitinispirillia bacterium]